MYLGLSTNEYGTPVSRHICDTCGKEYTVCPAIPPKRAADWDGCLSVHCPTYDMSRDADLLFDMGVVQSRPHDQQKGKENDF